MEGSCGIKALDANALKPADQGGYGWTHWDRVTRAPPRPNPPHCPAARRGKPCHKPLSSPLKTLPTAPVPSHGLVASKTREGHLIGAGTAVRVKARSVQGGRSGAC